MATLTSERNADPWKRRIFLPNYQIGEAAKYAQISPQTVHAWHKEAEDQRTLSFKENRAALSYLQLIEVAVVAAFRRANVSLKEIRRAREYAKRVLKAEFPFSQYKFKTDGKDLLMDYKQIVGTKKGADKLLVANKQGQLAWSQIIGTLKDFDYDGGLAIRWHVAGEASPVIIDPRISFGAPTVSGTPTWVIAGRRDAGESIEDIAEDFGLKKAEVKKALEFEGWGENKEWAN
jgi:uncharacterized protein (DUF433 family)/transposase-like protein